MCGVLDVRAAMTPKLTLGYRRAVAAADSVLARAGDVVHGHEFHRTAADPRRRPPARLAVHHRNPRRTRDRERRRLLPAHPLGRPSGRRGQVHRRLPRPPRPPGQLQPRSPPREAADRGRRRPRRPGTGHGQGRPRAPRGRRGPGPGAGHAEPAGVPGAVPRSQPGRAETIIRAYVAADRIRRLEFALNDTGGVTPRRAAAWHAAATAVAGSSPHGAATVAFGTLGDPGLYSTFSYLAQTVRDLVPEVTVETVAGITAMQDLASRAGLVAGRGHRTGHARPPQRRPRRPGPGAGPGRRPWSATRSAPPPAPRPSSSATASRRPAAWTAPSSAPASAWTASSSPPPPSPRPRPSRSLTSRP